MNTLFVNTKQFIPQIAALIREGHSVTIVVRGRSMRPLVENGDKAILTPFKEIIVDDVVLANVGNEHYVVHRVIAKNGNELTLMGDGNVKGVEHCTLDRVFGKVSTYIHKNQRYRTSGFGWRVYSSVWRNLLFMRRYLLAAYRILFLKRT